MDEQYIGVTEHLLRKNDYVKNYQQILRRNLLFDEFLEFLLHIYASYKAFSRILHDPISAEDQNFSLFRSFKAVLLSLIRQFVMVTSFHETELAKLKHRKNEELSSCFQRLIGELQGFEPQQKMYKATLKRIADKADHIRKEAAKTKEAQNDLINFFSDGYLYNRYLKLHQELTETNQAVVASKQSSHELGNLRTNFINEVGNFRKALANTRYSILDRFKGLCSDAKGGLATLFSILLESIRRGKLQFQKDTNETGWNELRSSRMKTKADHSEKSRSTESFLTHMNRVTSDYNRRLTDLIRFVGMFVETINELVISFRVASDKHKRSLLQSLGNNFEMAQSPLPWVKSACEMFEDCTARLGEMSAKLRESQGELTALSQKLKRHLEISISLLQVTAPQLRASSLSQDQNANNVSGQIAYHATELEKNVNNFEIESICKRIFDVIEDRLQGIVKYIEGANPLRRKQHVENSMDVSMVTEYDQVIFQREATREEGWLYVDWRDSSYRLGTLLEQAKSALEQIKTSAPPVDTGADIESYNCVLANREVKGTLTVRDKDVKFVSMHGNLHLKVPYSEMDGVTSKTKFLIGDFLMIDTSKGQLTFDVSNSEASKCKEKIQEQKDSAGGGDAAVAGEAAAAEAPSNRRKKVVLEAAELAFIAQRRARIQGELPDKSKLTSLNQVELFKDIEIDDFFDSIYSDAPKIIKGKKWEAPMIYILKNSGCYKLKFTPFRKLGPKFYTGAEGVTFQNCPLFSERETQYDHDLPKTGIPFMPAFVHVKNSEKLYWVSNEQFYFYFESRTSGAPYASTFFVKMMHIVKKKGSDIEIEFCGGMEFIESPPFKSIMIEKTQKQMKENLTKNIALIRQRVEAFKNSKGQEEEKIAVTAIGEAGTAEKDEEEEDSGQSSMAKELESVKRQNRIILVVSAVVLLLSILMKLY